MVQLQAGVNTEFKEKTICTIHDLHINLHVPDLNIEPKMLWMVECILHKLGSRLLGSLSDMSWTVQLFVC